MNIPADLKYTESHEWVRAEADGTVTVGITEYAQDALGDIVFVELPKSGQLRRRRRRRRGGIGEGRSDIYAPVAGEVVAVNEDVVNAPESINATPTLPGCSRSSRPTLAPSTACWTPPPTARTSAPDLQPRPIAWPRAWAPPSGNDCSLLYRPAHIMTRTSLTQLEARDAFIARHIGPDAAEQQEMLSVLGYASRAALIDAIVPANIRNKNAAAGRLRAADAGTGSAGQAENRFEKQGAQVADRPGLLQHPTPGVILRNIFENPAWYTAYTPYQPEISQGRLEAILNFQQTITDLTGMGIANASMLDEGTAAAEAMTLIQRVGKSKSNVFYVADDVLPQTLEVVQTRAKPLASTSRFDAAELAGVGDCFGVLLQYPGVNGDVRDYKADVATVKAKGAMVVAAADLLALTMLTPPGEWGADVVVGNSSASAYRWASAARTPATWPPATNSSARCRPPGRRDHRRARQQGLPPGAANPRAAHPPRKSHFQHLHRTGAAGRDGVDVRRLPRPARPAADRQRVHRLTGVLAANLKTLGYTITNDTFFDTLTVAVKDAAAVHAWHSHGVNLRVIDATHVGVSLDETTTRDDIALLWTVFAPVAGRTGPDLDAVEATVAPPSRPRWPVPAPT
jgi:glycine dehydrogenase